MSERFEIIENGIPVGQFQFDFYANTAFLHGAMIFEGYRNQGIMKRALNSIIIPIARSKGMTQLILIARTDETQLIWTKMGFTSVEFPLMELHI